MKKILLFLLLFINILSFSEFNDKAQLNSAINKTINQFNETEKNKLFNEMMKKKSVLTDEMIQFNDMEVADKKKQKSFRILMEMITEQHLKNIIYNSKIELYDITNIS